jgi:YVTN family beta-propeller protein
MKPSLTLIIAIEWSPRTARRGAKQILQAACVCASMVLGAGAAAAQSVVFPTGAHPEGLTFDGSNIWVVNQGDNNIWKIRASDGAKLGSFGTGGTVPRNAAFDGTHIWVTNLNVPSISKIRASDGALLQTVSLNGGGWGVLFDGTYIWAVSGPGNSRVSKIRPSDGAILGSFPTGGSGSLYLAFDGANIWVTNQTSQTVSKLRTADGASLGTFPTGANPKGVTFDGANIWVANQNDGTVSKIRALDGANLGVFPAGVSPVGTVFDGTNLWVANAFSNSVSRIRPADGAYLGAMATGGTFPGEVLFDGVSVWVTNAQSASVSRFAGTPSESKQPGGVAVNSLTNQINVAVEEGASISVIDGISNSTITVDVGPKPRYLALDPLANRLYVTRYFCRCVTVVDTLTRLKIADVAVGGNPLAVAVNPASSRVYVAVVKDSTQGGSFEGLVVIDGVTNTVAGTVAVGASPAGVAVNPGPNWIYVTNLGSHTISVVSGATNGLVATIPISGASDDIDVNGDTGRVYAPNPASKTVNVIDGLPGSANVHSVIATIPVGNSPASVAVDRTTNRIYVANASDRTVSVIDGFSNTVVSTVSAGGTTGLIAVNGGLDVNTATHRVYVSHQQEGYVSFFDTATLPPPGPPGPPPPPAPVGTISGRVIDPSGNGVGGAFFQVCPSAFAGRCAVTGLTNASGGYVSPQIDAGLYDITAFPPMSRPDLRSGALLQVRFSGGNLTGMNVRLQGQPQNAGSISGTVSDQSNNPLPGSRVQACLTLAGSQCGVNAIADASGHYRVASVPPGTYDIKAFPPAGSPLVPGVLIGRGVVANVELTGQDFRLSTANAPPANTGLLPQRTTREGVPKASWIGYPTLFTTGCPGGKASFSIDQVPPKTSPLARGVLAENPAGHYTGSITWIWYEFLNNPFQPGPIPPVEFGPAIVSIRLACPNGTTPGVQFNIYIDPSGAVKTPLGTPIPGATVSLFRSDTGSPGSFSSVPDGDAVMSPSNRQNPDTTNNEGQFGWDVLSGFYVVRAQKAGCHAPGDPSQPFVDSLVLTIPPAVLDLDLRLEGPGCAEDTTAPLTVASTTTVPNVAGWNNAEVTVMLQALDNPGGAGVKQITYGVTGAQSIPSTVVAGSVATVSITVEGVSVVTFFATDNAGNIETGGTSTIMLDRTPPTISGIRSPAPNVNGWNNTPVTVSFQCGDNLSGLAPGSPPPPTVVTTEGANQSVSGSCMDVAGNVASATVQNISIDTSCATDVSSSVSVTRSGYTYNFATQRFFQTVKLTNSSTSTISGPVSLVLDGLSANASLFNSSGATTCAALPGRPFVTTTAPSLAPGASVSVVLQFTNPTKAATTYGARVLAGSGIR